MTLLVSSRPMTPTSNMPSMTTNGKAVLSAQRVALQHTRKDAHMEWMRNHFGTTSLWIRQKVTLQVETASGQDDGWKTVGGDIGTLDGPARLV